MKVRTGFVSNSSSSSFIVNKKYLSEEQVGLIYNHIEHDKKNKLGGFEWGGEYDRLGFAWEISEEEVKGYIHGYIFMANFEMDIYLEKIGVPMDKVSWAGYHGEPRIPEIIE